MKKLVLILVISPLVSANYSAAQNDILTEIRDVSPEEIAVTGFTLEREQRIQISSIGFRSGGRHGLIFTRAWILDSRSREVVWDLEDADSDRRSRRLVEYKDTIHLPEGDYEVYFAAFPGLGNKRGWGDFFGRIIDDIFNDANRQDLYDEFREELRSFNIVVRGRGNGYDEHEVSRLHDDFNRNAFVSMTRSRNDESFEQGFTLDRPAEIRIYSLGEMTRDGTFDYGWIINADTREKVWKMNYRDSDHAGGAQKNRLVNEVIELPDGRYVACYVTDGSHSFHDWNEPPPYDPAFWGLTLSVADPRLKRTVDVFDYEAKPLENVIVNFTRLRDEEFLSQCFELKRDLDLHVYAIGEGRGGEMFDYGWIVDGRTHRKVWEMDFHDTEHAGGGDKNRLFDRVIRFEKGSYIAYYVTDVGHSYWDWNTAPPLDKESWGMTIAGVDRRFRSSDVSDCKESSDASILVQLVRVRDSERERARFSLDRDSEVRIYAIVEGQDGSMYDFGWIENADTRRVVWEMTYRMTDHAGGGKKNRVFNDTIFLRRGEYIVYYETDDSHSFPDWNVDPPHDPGNWGITVYSVEE